MPVGRRSYPACLLIRLQAGKLEWLLTASGFHACFEDTNLNTGFRYISQCEVLSNAENQVANEPIEP